MSTIAGFAWSQEGKLFNCLQKLNNALEAKLLKNQTEQCVEGHGHVKKG